MLIVGSVALLFAHLGQFVAGIAVVVASAYLGFRWRAGGLTVVVAIITIAPFSFYFGTKIGLLCIFAILTALVLFLFLEWRHADERSSKFSFSAHLLAELRIIAPMVTGGAAAFLLLSDYLFVEGKRVPLLDILVLVWILLPVLNALIDYASWRLTANIVSRIDMRRIRIFDCASLLFVDLVKGFIILFFAVEIYMFSTVCFLQITGNSGSFVKTLLVIGPQDPASAEIVWFVVLSMTALFPSLLHAVALPEALNALSRGAGASGFAFGIPSLLSAPAAIIFVLALAFAALQEIRVGWLTWILLPIVNVLIA
jgi:hypothetical protein